MPGAGCHHGADKAGAAHRFTGENLANFRAPLLGGGDFIFSGTARQLENLAAVGQERDFGVETGADNKVRTRSNE